MFRLWKYSWGKYEASDLADLLRVGKNRAFFSHSIMKDIRSKCKKDCKVDNNSIIIRTVDEDMPMFAKSKSKSKPKR